MGSSGLGVGTGFRENPLSAAFGLPGLAIAGKRAKKKKAAIAAVESQKRAQETAETQRKAAEAEASSLAQKERARRRTLFAGALPEARTSLFARRLGGTRGQLAQTLGGNAQ